MNNWEVYKLLAHVRPPVSKVLPSYSPCFTLACPQSPSMKCFSQLLVPQPFQLLCPTITHSAESLTLLR